MKFIYLVILGIVIVESRYQFTFSMNSADIYNATLQFRTDAYVSQLSLRCDNLTYDVWKSYNYQYLEVSASQRRAYECSDTNFTLTVSNDFNKDEIVISVYDANFYKEISRFNFLSNNTNTPQQTLNDNQAYLKSLTYTMNDFKITLYSPQAIYMEIFKCQNSYSQLSVKGYDQNMLYHNVSKMSYKDAFFDVIDANNGDYYYRLSQSSYSTPDVFIKYQTAPSYSIDHTKIKEYGDKYYTLSGYVSQGKIHVSIPRVQVTKNENVEFHITVSQDSYEGNYFPCIYGDKSLYNQYAQNYYSEFTTFYQNRNYGSENIEIEFPNQEPGWYNVRVSAIVNHGYIKQTITYDKLIIYQDYIIFPDTLLVHVLAPIIVSIIALLGLIVGSCRFSAKKKKMQQQELLQQYQNNINHNIQIQNHPSY